MPQGFDCRWCNGLEKSIRDGLLDNCSTDVQAVHPAAVDEVFAGAVITRSRVPAAIMYVQTSATVFASDDSLQQCRSLSHCPSRLVWSRLRIGIESSLVGLESGPIDKAGMMVPDNNGPLIQGQMPHPLSDDSLFIDVAFVPGLAVGVSASIHRIGEDLVECMIGGGNPADRAGQAGGRGLQWKRQAFGTEPEPHPACRAEFGEPFEYRADGAGYSRIGVEEDFAILFSPNEAHGQPAPQFSASGLVANTAVEAGADNVQLGFAHGAFQPQQQPVVE